MAIAPLWVSIRTTGAAALGGAAARLRALGSTAGGLSRTWRQHTRQVSSVAGAYRDANGLWRNANGTLLTQRHHVTQVTTAYGHLARAARNAGSSIADGMRAIGPEGIAAAAAIGAVIAPAIGAAISAGILTALGGGVMGAAVALAIKQSEALQKAFGRTFKDMGDEAKVWASGFEDELFGVTDRFASAWDSISDNLGAAFQQAQKYVEPFAEGISQLVENMFGGGGFNAAMEAAEPVIKEFSRGLGEVGKALDSFFDSLADSGDGDVKGMIVLMAALSGAIRAAGNTIEFLARAFDFVTDAGEKFARSMEIMVGGLEGLSGLLPGFGDAWEYAGETLGLFNDSASKTKDLMPILGVATDGASGSIDRQAAAAAAAAKAAQELSNKLHGLISDTLSADQAALQWEVAIDAVTAAIQENGRNIDTNTAKGQANVQQILEAVAAAEAKYQADLKLAGGEHASAEAVAAANAAYSAQIERLAATLRQAGLTEAQINALLGKYRELANAPNIQKSVTITTYFREVGGPNYAKQSGNQIAYAGGTSSARAGVALVGEEGPELVRFNGGEAVSTAAETARMLGGSWPRATGAGRGSSGGGVWRVEAAPGHAGNWLVQGFLAALHGGQLRIKAGPAGRIVPA